MTLLTTVHALGVDNKCIDGVCAATIKGFEGIFANVVGAVLGLAGIVLFIMITLGGFKYITAGGDPKATAAARQTLTYAVLGLVLIASAYLILALISKFTGANILIFKVYQD